MIRWLPFLPVSYTHLDVYKRQPLYCIEPGADLNSAVDKLSYSEGTWAALTGSKLELLGRVFLYSYTKGNPNASAASRQQYIATQMLVWEVMAGQRDDNFNKINNGYTPVSDLFKSGNMSNPRCCLHRMQMQRARAIG